MYVNISGRVHTVDSHGKMLKEVTCENCQIEFVYILERRAKGIGFSPYCLDDEGAAQRAAAASVNRLRKWLAQGFDIVPCPSCGHYQEYMIPWLRGDHRIGLWKTAVAMLYAAAVLAIVTVMIMIQPNYRGYTGLWLLCAALIMVMAARRPLRSWAMRNGTECRDFARDTPRES